MRTGGKHRVTESHTVVTYIVAVHDALFTCVVIDAAAFNAGWGLGQEMARAGLEAERLPPPKRGAFWRHIFSILFPYFLYFCQIFLEKKYSKNMKKYGKI